MSIAPIATPIFWPFTVIDFFSYYTHMKRSFKSVVPLLLLSSLSAYGEAERSEFYPHATAHLPQIHWTAETESERERPELCLKSGWASKYVSEGVDNWDGDGLWIINPELSWQGFTFSPWYGVSDSHNVKELQLVLSYDWTLWEHLTVSPFYEHDFVYPGGEDAANPGITLSWHFDDHYCAGVNAQWLAAHGDARGYYEGWVEAHYSLYENVELTCTVVCGFNEGYLCDTAYGANTMDYSVELGWQALESVYLGGSVNYSQALASLRQAGLGDEFWYSFNVHYSF